MAGGAMAPPIGAVQGAAPAMAGVVSASTEASIREAIAQYEARLRASGTPQPWKLVDQLADDLLDEILTSCAQGLLEAADAFVDRLVADELRVPAGGSTT
jgi:hypothetical protein